MAFVPVLLVSPEGGEWFAHSKAEVNNLVARGYKRKNGSKGSSDAPIIPTPVEPPVSAKSVDKSK